ncbi:MAG: DUF512 domain-containing protein [Firmicutes bacterium]|nr:DUF512 domain-containing protein [Bacillota bacterium]
MGGVLIGGVIPGSPAARAGFKAGDRLWRLGCQAEGDIIDYRIWEADEQLTLLVQTGNGPLRRRVIRKAHNEPLGVQFDPPTITPLLRCRNRCLFCFIDQNPSGLRSSLYLKDDDYRLSFLHGNYITLNHLTARERERIIKLQLSPLYVSVHSTDPDIRSRLYRNRQARRGLDNLKFLVGAGIKIHAQVVLCPGYNLGEELLRTVKDLENMGEALLSVAVVPVGLTAHGRPPAILRRITPAEAAEIVEGIHRLQSGFLKKRGSRFVFLSDEIYYRAGAPYPEREHYEGFPQLENGVGMARLFLDELPAVESSLPEASPRPLKITLVTGIEAAHLLKQLMRRLTAVRQLEAGLAIIENRFFGKSVTVAGLLTGEDLEKGLQDQTAGEAVFIPQEMLREGGDLFLDGLTWGELEQRLHTSLIPVRGPLHFARELKRLTGAVEGGN